MKKAIGDILIIGGFVSITSGVYIATGVDIALIIGGIFTTLMGGMIHKS